MKPLIDCCKEYAKGTIDGTNFFTRSLIRTGEFVQSVEKKKETEAPENP